MLGETLKARIPVITIRTPDPASVSSVVAFHTGRTPRVFEQKFLSGNGKAMPSNSVFIIHAQAARNLADDHGLYYAMFKAGSTCVVVNPAKDIPMSFDVGVMDVPSAVLASELETGAGIPHEVSMLLVDGLEGLTPLEARWLVSLVRSNDQKLTLDNLRRARIKQSPPTRGLSPVSTDIGFYVCNDVIEEWLAISSGFLNHRDRRLRPRGLLFRGEAGTGKTMGSKHISGVMGLPLYRLEVGSVKSKFVGESERNLRDALAAADRYAPIALLIDEVEKVLSYGSTSDAGTSNALLGQLLWWLQEHDSPVLTLMTTNNIDLLPPELYRPGRIDHVIEVPPLEGVEIWEFAKQCFETFDVTVTDGFVSDTVSALCGAGASKSKSHAEVTAAVVEAVKKLLLYGVKQTGTKEKNYEIR